MSLSFLVSAWAVKEMQVKMAHKASGIEDRRMKTSPFERGADFISSRRRNKKPDTGPGFEHQFSFGWDLYAEIASCATEIGSALSFTFPVRYFSNFPSPIYTSLNHLRNSPKDDSG